MRLQAVNFVLPGFLLLVICNFTIHFYNLSYPNGIVYDEFHFGKFASAYCCNFENQFDLHPPHAKLLIAGALKLAGYNGQFEFDEIGKSYEGQFPVIPFRILPALFGFLLPFVFFWLLRLLKVSPLIALLGAWIVTLENGLIVQSRFALLDSFLLTSFVVSICFVLAAIQNKKGSRHRNKLLFLAGAASGLATGSKLTGGLSLIIIGLILFEESHENIRLFIKSKLVMLSGFALVYLIGWKLHFLILHIPGPADIFFTESGNFFSDIWNLHIKMLEENARLLKPHKDASSWWKWPVMIKSVYYYASDESDIFFTGNVFVWIGSSLSFIPATIYLVKRNLLSHLKWIGPFGAIVSMSPFLFFERATFLYHYLLTLICILLTVIVALSEWGHKSQVRKRLIPKIFASCVIGSLIGFILSAPLTFGLSRDIFSLFNLGPFWR